MSEEAAERRESRVRAARIPLRLLTEMMAGGSWFQARGIPEGARFLEGAVQWDLMSRSFLALVEHESFDAVPDGEMAPMLDMEIVGRREEPAVSAARQGIDRLAQFILKEAPQEIGKGDPQSGEGAVDVAIRLLRDHALPAMRLKEDVRRVVGAEPPEAPGHVLQDRGMVDAVRILRRLAESE